MEVKRAMLEPDVDDEPMWIKDDDEELGRGDAHNLDHHGLENLHRPRAFLFSHTRDELGRSGRTKVHLELRLLLLKNSRESYSHSTHGEVFQHSSCSSC